MKTAKTAHIIAMILALCPAKGICQSTREIVRTYDRMVEENAELAHAYVPLGEREGREPLKNLFYLRPRGLNKFLIDNFSFTGRSFYDDDFIVSKTNVEFQSEEGFYPSYLVLLGSGMGFDEIFEVLLASKRSVSSMANAIDMLGLTYSGPFFNRYVETISKTDEYAGAKKFLDKYLAQESVMEELHPRSNLMLGFIHPVVMPEEFRTEQGRQFLKLEEVLVGKLRKEIQDRRAASVLSAISAMGHIRSLEAVPLLVENLTICPQVSTNVPGGYIFPAAEALIEIGPAIGYCFGQLEKSKPLSLEESLWLRISHELYPEGLEYDLMRRAETNDCRAARLLGTLPWRRLAPDYSLIPPKGR